MAVQHTNMALLVSMTSLLGHPTTNAQSEENLPPSDTRIEARIARLEQEVENLKIRRNADWSDYEQARAVRTIVNDVLLDAELHTGGRFGGIKPGYDGDFYIQSEDDQFRLEVSGQIQIRHVYNRQEGELIDRNTAGFSTRRVKIKFDGYVYGDVAYSIGGAMDRSTGEFAPQGLFIEYPLTDQLKIKVGRARSPLLREEQISSKKQLLAERSLVAKAFPQSRTVGATIKYRAERYRIFAGVSDSFGGDSWLVSTRAEVLLLGRWRELGDLTSFPSSKPVIAMGAGVLYQERDTNDFTTGPDQNVIRWTADATLELGGVHGFAAIVGNYADTEGEVALTQIGIVAQGGFFLTDTVEVFGQYMWGDAGVQGPDLNVATVGINYYFSGHDVKFTFDVGYGFNEVGAPWSSSGAGWRRDAFGIDGKAHNGQIVARSQLQLLY